MGAGAIGRAVATAGPTATRGYWLHRQLSLLPMVQPPPRGVWRSRGARC